VKVGEPTRMSIARNSLAIRVFISFLRFFGLLSMFCGLEPARLRMRSFCLEMSERLVSNLLAFPLLFSIYGNAYATSAGRACG
jgi:hypothetical protein